jgi:hypothetical protein
MRMTKSKKRQNSMRSKSGRSYKSNAWAKRGIENLIVEREYKAADLEEKIVLINEAYTDAGGNVVELTDGIAPLHSNLKVKILSRSSFTPQTSINHGLTFASSSQRILEENESLDLWSQLFFDITQNPLSKDEYDYLRAIQLATYLAELRKLKRQIKTLRRKLIAIDLVRDIRKLFRTIIRFLFKNMDDESGDEVIAKFNLAISKTSNSFYAAQTRMHRYY